MKIAIRQTFYHHIFSSAIEAHIKFLLLREIFSISFISLSLDRNSHGNQVQVKLVVAYAH